MLPKHLIVLGLVGWTTAINNAIRPTIRDNDLGTQAFNLFGRASDSDIPSSCNAATANTSPSAKECSTMKTLLSTANQWLQIYKTLNPNVTTSIQTSDFGYDFAPDSINPPPTFNKTGYAAHISSFREVLKGLPVTPRHSWPNSGLKQVIIWADSQALFHDCIVDGKPNDWSFRGEYIFVLDMDSTAKKVKHVLEFVDSKKLDSLIALFAKAQEKKSCVKQNS